MIGLMTPPRLPASVDTKLIQLEHLLSAYCCSLVGFTQLGERQEGAYMASFRKAYYCLVVLKVLGRRLDFPSDSYNQIVKLIERGQVTLNDYNILVERLFQFYSDIIARRFSSSCLNQFNYGLSRTINFLYQSRSSFFNPIWLERFHSQLDAHARVLSRCLNW